ncbi:DUF1818 family protein [Tumidithrix helvetica]|uniref:DUF1818 family protein n=1 Tax=Tumidithrix helvetica TaxID=3457545 RepID=UPI003CC60873
MPKRMASGAGWRLGWQSEAEVFEGLVGGDRWAIELTGQELRDFCRLSLQLADTMTHMETELSDREKLTCTAATEMIRVEVTGYPQEFSLHAQLQVGRRAELDWAASSVPELIAAIKNLTAELNPA